MMLVSVPDAVQDLDRLLDRRFVNRDRLEAPFQRRVRFDMLAVFFQGGRADALQLAPGQGRLENIGRVY